MELQESLHDLQRAGVAVFAISYDPVEVLAGFAEKHGITYPLLSDAGSRVIHELGLFNAHLDAQQAHFGVAVQERHRGVPYPGTFVLNADGVVTEKLFEQHHRTRLAAPALAAAAGAGATRTEAAAAAQQDGVTVRVSVPQPLYRPWQKVPLRIRLDIPEGTHVYGQPAGAGLVALDASIEALEGLEAGPLELPPPQMGEVLGEPYPVYHGTVTGVLWFAINRFAGDVTLVVNVTFQACTDYLCYPPATLTIPLALAGVDLVRD